MARNPHDLALLPWPREVSFGSGWVAASEPVARRDASLPPQGYRLSIRDGGEPVGIAAADDAGEFYAMATLGQLRRHRPGELPVCEIVDWPDFAVRGAMLDISRDKVPTVATVKALIERLASLKLNHLQLYTEHTFAYAGHEDVWSAASPFTADEIRDVESFCAERHVELSANQNCLGHMERWLLHDAYKPLAISPDGWTDPRGRHRRPTTIDPAKPASLALARELLSQLVPLFGSRRVNVGLDEPWELSDDRFEEYLGYVARLRAAPELDGRQMLMWGDIVAHHPERVGALPDGVTVCEWGYEADHPFAERTKVLADSGRPFWVCPGTSSWNTIVGRWTNARDNCLSAAESGARDGAEGYLIADWGDNGHLQYLPFSEPGLAAGAAMSWCTETNRDLDFAAALDAHVFGDASRRTGTAMLALGDVHRLITPQIPNVSSLVLHLYYPQLVVGERISAGMTIEDLLAVEQTIDNAVSSVEGAELSRPDADLVLDEIRAGAALVALLSRDARARLAGDGTLASVGHADRGALASEAGRLLDRHQDLWLARNRPGGLADSSARLERLHDAYLEPGSVLRVGR